MRKIAVCGKGGNGRSTLVALMTKELCRCGKRVLVGGSDEPNAGLYGPLGYDKIRAPKERLRA